MSKTILVVGAGIAGLTAAYWLNQYGFSVELIEKSSNYPRNEGYLMDFWGAGFNVCEKMDLLPALLVKDFPLHDFIFVDAKGNVESRFSIAELRVLQKQRVFTLFRGDLENVLFQTIAQSIPVRSNTFLTRCVNHENGVNVTFNDGSNKQYDIVIGADGAHSKTREQVFGPERNFSHYLGHQVAACIEPCTTTLERSLYTYSSPGRQTTVCFLENNRVATFYVYAEKNEKIENPKEKLIAAFHQEKWIIPELIENVDKADTVFFDSLSQINLSVWHKGHVVLVGDASHCLTLAAGQGASMAMAGAYILSTMINQHRDDYGRAFSQYQAIMQPGMLHKQRESQKFLTGFIPKSDDAMGRRDFYTRYFFKAMFEKTDIEKFCAR